MASMVNKKEKKNKINKKKNLLHYICLEFCVISPTFHEIIALIIKFNRIFLQYSYADYSRILRIAWNSRSYLGKNQKTEKFYQLLLQQNCRIFSAIFFAVSNLKLKIPRIFFGSVFHENFNFAENFHNRKRNFWENLFAII